VLPKKHSSTRNVTLRLCRYPRKSVQPTDEAFRPLSTSATPLQRTSPSRYPSQFRPVQAVPAHDLGSSLQIPPTTTLPETSRTLLRGVNAIVHRECVAGWPIPRIGRCVTGESPHHCKSTERVGATSKTGTRMPSWSPAAEGAGHSTTADEDSPRVLSIEA
jgi:hypothetical protein